MSETLTNSPLVAQIAEILSDDDLANFSWDPSSDSGYEEMAKKILRSLPEVTDVQKLAAAIRDICSSDARLADVRFEAKLVRAARDIYDCWTTANGGAALVRRSIPAAELDEQMRRLWSLQNGLVEALEAIHGSLAHIDWPRSGTVKYEEQTWSFHRHGAGFTFESNVDGRSVNAHDRMELRPVPLDAWRIECFLDSLGFTTIRVGDEELDVDRRTLDPIMARLVLLGSWTATGPDSFQPSSMRSARVP